MKKIKVIRIIARLNIGGPAIHTVLLTEGLDKTRFDSLLVYGSLGKKEGDMFYYAEEKNIMSYFIKELHRDLSLWQDILTLKKIYTLIKKEKPDIIHTHTAKAGALGRLAAILYNFTQPPKLRIKLVHTFHGHVFRGYFNPLQTKLFILIERFLAIFTTRILTVNESLKGDLLKLNICRADKISIVPLGLELEKFMSINQRNDNMLNIGIVGRLVPVKNHRLFLDAAVQFIQNNRDINIHFKIIGDGELKEQLKEYTAKLKITSYIDFLSWQKDLVKVYSELDTVVLTSLNEGTPVSLIEAMAAGKAVVATNVGGVPDLLGREIKKTIKPDMNFNILERGIMVNSHDAFGLAAALGFLSQDKQLRSEMGERARNFVKKNFAKERLIKDIENLYENIINCHPPA